MPGGWHPHATSGVSSVAKHSRNIVLSMAHFSVITRYGPANIILLFSWQHQHQPTSTNTNNLPFQIRENCNAPIQSQPVAIVVINYRVYFQAALHERTPPAYAEPDGSNGASRQAAEGQAETGQQTGKHDKNCCNAIGDAYPAPQTWNQSTNDKPRRGWQYGQCQLPAEYSRPRHSFLRFRLGARHRTITYYLFIQNSGLLTRCTNANNSQAIGVTKYTLHLF